MFKNASFQLDNFFDNWNQSIKHLTNFRSLKMSEPPTYGNLEEAPIYGNIEEFDNVYFNEDVEAASTRISILPPWWRQGRRSPGSFK